MNLAKNRFYFFGRTSTEKFTNIFILLAGVIFVLYSSGYLNFERVLKIEIQTDKYEFISHDKIASDLNAFSVDSAKLATIASKVQSSVEDVNKYVVFNFDISSSDTAIILECASSWPQDKLQVVCVDFSDAIKKYLDSIYLPKSLNMDRN